VKEIITTITQRGQVTIPAEVRRLLGARPRDKIAFQIDGDEVRLAPVTFTLEAAFGSVPPLSRPEDFDAITRIARERASSGAHETA
jgi:AbrB family looped-hinge helix DNA binding protein